MSADSAPPVANNRINSGPATPAPTRAQKALPSKPQALVGKDGSTPGNRRMLFTEAEASTLASGDAVRAYLADPARVQTFCDRLMEGLGDHAPQWHKRTSMNLYPRVMRLIGAEEDLAAALLRSLGMGLDIAKQQLALAAGAQHMAADPEAMRTHAEQHLLRVYREQPALAYRSPLRRVLFAVEQQDPEGGAPGA